MAGIAYRPPKLRWRIKSVRENHAKEQRRFATSRRGVESYITRCFWTVTRSKYFIHIRCIRCRLPIGVGELLIARKVRCLDCPAKIACWFLICAGELPWIVTTLETILLFEPRVSAVLSLSRDKSLEPNDANRLQAIWTGVKIHLLIVT